MDQAEGIALPNDVYEAAPRIKLSRRAIITGLAAGTILPIATGCATNPVTGANQMILPGFDNASLAQMSRAAWSDMKRQTPTIRGGPLRRRVEGVWQRTARGRVTSLQNQYGQRVAYNPSEWDLAVFDTDDVNAFVMPGQQVGVFRGITELTENDDQLASILGHEAGHVDGRHAAARASMQTTASLAMAAGQIAIAQSEELAQYGGQIAALGGAALQFGLLLPYSRRHELEADKLGVDYMHAAGYDVTQSIRLWELMDKKGGGQRPPEFMSTHPSPTTRIQELRNHINARGYALV